MKPYSSATSKGRTVAVDDVHHRTADQPRPAATAAAKKLRHGARQHANRANELFMDSVDGAALAATDPF